MNLRSRIPAYLGVILLAMLVVLYSTISLFIFRAVQQIEKTNMESFMDDTTKAINSEADSIQTSTEDYAAWTDTYNYVKNKNQDYIDQNMGSDSFTNLKMNIAAIFDDKQQLIYSKHFDWQNNKELPMPADFLSVLEKHKDIFSFTNTKDLHSVFLNFDGTLMFVATRPIVTSDFQGPIVGTFMYTRNFDPSYISRLSTLTGLNISMDSDISPQNIATIFSPDKLTAPDTQRAVQFVGNNEMQGFFTLKDNDGNVLTILKIDHDRPVNMLTLRSIWTMFIILGLLITFMVLGSLGLIDWLIFRRLTRLSNAVVHYQSDPSQMARMSILGNDELTALTKTIKSSFQELDLSKKKLRTHANKINLERKKLDAILKSIAEGVLVVDDNGKILLINQIAKTFSGKSYSALLNTPFFQHLKFSNENGKFLDMSFLKSVFQKGDVVNIEDNTLQLKGDKMIHVALSAAPVISDKKVISAVIIFRDKTHEYEVNKMKSEFISIASHQLRTPLTSIKWMISILLHEYGKKLEKTESEYLHNIQTSSERMIQLVTDLLNVSHIEKDNGGHLEKTDIDLKKMIGDILSEQESIAANLKVSIKTHFPKANLVIQADNEKIYQALMNIINNALKYSIQGGIVDIQCKIEEKSLLITVQDSGIGIPLNEQPNIFGKFFRAENAKKLVSIGSGLGLYYVKSVIESHGGQIWFTSIQDKGTTFHISLPL